MADYNIRLKTVLSKLFDIVLKSKWNSISLDSFDDDPFVDLYVPPHHIKVKGHKTEGWLGPEDEDEQLHFVECCELALQTYVQFLHRNKQK
jgi:hypothetical protein